jgi:hypothetical protein
MSNLDDINKARFVDPEIAFQSGVVYWPGVVYWRRCGAWETDQDRHRATELEVLRWLGN